MSREFDLGVILSAISGVSFVDDFSQVADLYAFVYGMSMDLSMMAAMMADLKNRILKHYPELERINYCGISDIDVWLINQKANFGEKLLVNQSERMELNNQEPSGGCISINI